MRTRQWRRSSPAPSSADRSWFRGSAAGRPRTSTTGGCRWAARLVTRTSAACAVVKSGGLRRRWAVARGQRSAAARLWLIPSPGIFASPSEANGAVPWRVRPGSAQLTLERIGWNLVARGCCARCDASGTRGTRSRRPQPPPTSRNPPLFPTPHPEPTARPQPPPTSATRRSSTAPAADRQTQPPPTP